MAHLSKVRSATTVGLDAYPVEVEVDVGQGLPQTLIVGLPDKAVEESKERVRSAIKNTGFSFPQGRVTINLAPADVKKEGPGFDLPIALGALAADGQVAPPAFLKTIVVGELALNGAVRPTNGILAMMLWAKAHGVVEAFVPAANAREAALVGNITIKPVENFSQLILHLRGDKPLANYRPRKEPARQADEYQYDFKDVKGQAHAKRALEIAAAGGHNAAMTGPPGSGKTLLARSLPSILPPLSNDESLDVSRVYSVVGMLPEDSPLVRIRPFRSPHHTTSHIALVGGGTIPRPGEITLAHRGVLFLDEFPEFPRQALEALRQPLEDGVVVVARAAQSLQFPARFMLVAAMNPCPCGYLTDETRQCICAPSQILRYKKRLSGPLLDRIDLHIDVPRVHPKELTDTGDAEASSIILERVLAARERQAKRMQLDGITTNGEMTPRHMKKHIRLDDPSRELIKQAIAQLQLSARAFTRILKLSRTIADLAGEAEIQSHHLAEALQYRPKER